MKIRPLLFLVILIVMGCNKPLQTTHVVFVDYSLSSSIFKNDNPKKILDEIDEVWTRMIPKDRLFIYPIHKHTGSASYIIESTKPQRTGDLNSQNIDNIAKNKMFSSLESKLFNMQMIPVDTRLSTNIFPIIWKISNHFDINGKVEVYIFSDMIHEDKNINLNEILVSKTITEIDELVVEMYSDLSDFKAVRESTIHIKYPGLIQGGEYHERTVLNIRRFWVKLFELFNYDALFEPL